MTYIAVHGLYSTYRLLDSGSRYDPAIRAPLLAADSADTSDPVLVVRSSEGSRLKLPHIPHSLMLEVLDE